MIDRKVIEAAMQSILGRRPEEAAFARCQAAFTEVTDLVESLVASEEFKSRSWHAAAVESRALATERNWLGEPSDIEWAYETFLGRAPESYSVIADWLLQSPTKDQVVENFLTSAEFKSRAWHHAAGSVRARFINDRLLAQ